MSSQDPRTDLELIAAINGGERSAFDALYHRHRDWVVRLAFRFTGHEDDALDVLQEAFSYLARKFPGFRLTAAMTTFLYPVVKHLALASRRKRVRMNADDAAVEASKAADDSSPAPSQARGELSIVLGRLPDTHREVLLMRFVDGMSMEEIAAAMGIPAGTVKSRIDNALATLRADPRTRAYFDPA